MLLVEFDLIEFLWTVRHEYFWVDDDFVFPYDWDVHDQAVALESERSQAARYRRSPFQELDEVVPVLQSKREFTIVYVLSPC